MKFQARYGKEKFLNFSFDAQLKALSKLLKELEYRISDTEDRSRILEQIRQLYPLCKSPLPPRMQSLISGLPDDPFRLLRTLADYHQGSTLKDSQILLRTGDGSPMADPHYLNRSSKVKLVADNLRSVFNVGSLFRICECLALQELILCGITATPKHPNMAKTALGTADRVRWQSFDNSLDAVRELRGQGYTIYALETAEPSESVFEADFQLPLALVVGNEALGIDPKVLALCDKIVRLPVLGWKNSLNVSVASAITLYQIIFGADYGNN